MSRALPLLVMGGCALENPAFVVPLPGQALVPALSPSAAVVRSQLSGLAPDRLDAWALDDGGTAGVVLGGAVQAVQAVYRTRPDGSVSGAELGSESFALQGVSLGDEVFVADCPYQPRFGLTDPDLGYVQYDLRTEDGGVLSCGGPFGSGATRDRVVQYDPFLQLVYLHTLDRAARVDTVSLLGPSNVVLPEGAWIQSVFEDPAGSVTVVLVVGDELTFADAAGESVVASGLVGTLEGSFVGTDGVLRVTTSEALYRCDPVTGDCTSLAPAPSSPTGTDWVVRPWAGGASAEAGDANPGDPSVTIPTAMAVRYATDDTFEVFEPELTPCCDPEACRVVGESYLLGGIGSEGTEVVVYDVWSWIGDGVDYTHFGVARPVVDPCPDELGRARHR